MRSRGKKICISVGIALIQSERFFVVVTILPH